MNKRLGAYLFYGYFFMIGGVAVAASVFIPPIELGVIMTKLLGGIVFLGGWGIYLLKHAKKTYAKRLNALKNGKIVKGKVVEHGRAFVFYKSFRDYTVTIEFDGKRETIQSPKATLQESLPIGKSVTGLQDPRSGAIFFPQELDLEIEAN